MKMKPHVRWPWHLAVHLLIVGSGVLCLATDAFMTEKEIKATALPFLTSMAHAFAAVFYFGYGMLHLVFLREYFSPIYRKDMWEGELAFCGEFFEMIVMAVVVVFVSAAVRIKNIFVEETK